MTKKKLSPTLSAVDKVIALLTNRSHWVKNTAHAVKYVNGKPVDAYCLSGACNKVAPRQARTIMNMMTKAIESYTGSEAVGVATFNDRSSTSHRDVLRVLRITRTLFQVKAKA